MMDASTTIEPVSGSAIPQSSGSLAADTTPMLKFEKILLCTDYTAASRAPVELAAQLARQSGGRVTVLHVNEYGVAPTPVYDSEYLDERILQQERGVQAAYEELCAQGIAAESLVVEGNTPSAILEQIEQRGFDVAVLGTHAAHGVQRMIFGSTAEAVFRAASCPVITLGPQLHAGDEHAGPVIFATDFYMPAAEAIRHAAELAQKRGVALHCIHVMPSSMRQEGSSVAPEVMQEALKLLAKVPARLAEPVCRVLYSGDVARAIVDYARMCKAGMIVLSIRRKSRIAAHLPAHRVYRVITTAPCPVMTVCVDEPAVISLADTLL